MKKIFLDSSINFITKYNNYTEKEIEKLKYGLEGLYLTVSKMLIIFFLAFISNLFLELIIVIIFYNFLRFFGFGFHAEKSWQCLIFSVINFNIIPFIIFNINISTLHTLVISVICCISFLVFAPADTIKRPLKNKKKRLIRKFFTFGLGIIYSILSIIILPLRNYLLSALIIETISVLPLLYVITGQTYNNHK